MNRLINLVVILAVLGITGWLRMPYEQKLSKELHRLKLVPPRLSLEQRSLLKQKAFVATYGSLRPAIAAFMSVQTTNYHSDQEWDKIEKSFNEILLLDPYNYHYWDMASWHMASNAAIDKQVEKGLTEVGKQQIFNKYVQKGRDIVNRSVQVNPDDWRFYNLKAKLESNRHRNPDYAKAIETYRQLLKLPNLSENNTRATKIAIQYCMQQLPEWHQESYEHARELYELGDSYRVPTVLNEIFIGQNHPLNKIPNPLSLNEIYGSEPNAYQELKVKWQRRDLGQKPYGVEETIRELEIKYKIPYHLRVFPHRPLFMK
jgi:tetratricopeptide (TPR) repeat protein